MTGDDKFLADFLKNTPEHPWLKQPVTELYLPKVIVTAVTAYKADANVYLLCQVAA